MPLEHRNHATYFVPGLHRGLRALEVVGTTGRAMTISQVARELAVTRSSAFRTVYTLVQMGFLEEVENGRAYALGPRVLDLGFSYLNEQPIVRVSRSELEALRDHTGVSAHLGIREGRDVLFLDCVQTRTGFLSTVNVGARRPAHASPMGWLLLGNLDDGELAALYRDTPLLAMTDRTPTSLPALIEAVRDAAEGGHVVSHGIVERGGRSFTAPVRDRGGRAVAAIDVSGPESAFAPEQDDAFYVEAVRTAAERVSARLGHGGA